MNSKINLKINDREKKLLLILGGLILIFLVYRLLFVPLQNDNESLKSEAGQLEAQVEQMRGMVANQSSYESQTKEMKEEMDLVFDGIPSNLTAEDEILYAYNMEKQYDLTVTSLSMPDALLAYTMNADGNNVQDSGKLLYKVPMAIACDISYEGIKDYLRNLENEKYSKSIENISLTYNSETGRLSGTLTVNMYYLFGNDRAYTPQTIDGVSIGTDNIFGNTASNSGSN